MTKSIRELCEENDRIRQDIADACDIKDGHKPDDSAAARERRVGGRLDAMLKSMGASLTDMGSFDEAFAGLDKIFKKK